MARTTQGAVQGILGGTNVNSDWDEETPLGPFIETATVIVSRVAACAVAKDQTLTAAELELIERWLAAHFYKMRDPAHQSSNTAGAGATYQGQSGMYLDQTRYGQTAQSIDHSGCLTALSKRQRARVVWLGKTRSEQIDYENRS